MLELDKIYNMDCIEGMKQLDDDSIDSIVTDPPYGLEFMGKDWDKVPLQQFSYNWAKEAIRVLKPGAHVLVFGGTRTYHRMVCGIEDAGFEIRDCIQWIYGSGFPKSLSISKAIDKMKGVEREVIAKIKDRGKPRAMCPTGGKRNADPSTYLTTPATPEAKQWDGWGTALKPANEPIVVARKPLSKKTVALNVLKWGTGGINIDGCRVGLNGEKPPSGSGKNDSFRKMEGRNDKFINETKTTNIQGRFPANVIFDEEAGKMLDEQSGTLRSGNLTGSEPSNTTKDIYGKFSKRSIKTVGDKGGASRFFYCAKASKLERNIGLKSKNKTITKHNAIPRDWENINWEKVNTNYHPTVKPIKLMEYLVKLVTPPNGIVLDCFMGSGTTAIACKKLNCHFIGFETDINYYKLANKRLEQEN